MELGMLGAIRGYVVVSVRLVAVGIMCKAAGGITDGKIERGDDGNAEYPIMRLPSVGVLVH